METCGSTGKLAQLSLDAIPVWFATPDRFLLADVMIIRNFAKQNNYF